MSTGSLFNPTPLSDGPVHSAADHNTPAAQLATILNSGIGTVNIIPGGLDDSVLAATVSPVTRWQQMGVNFVFSGYTIATSGTLSSTIIAGIAYIDGKQVTITNQPITVVASKDTYVDIKDDGTVVSTGSNSVANGAASPAIATNTDGSSALRIAKLVSNGTTITTSVQTLFDSIGNAIYNTNPFRTLIGYGQIVTSYTNTSASYVKASTLTAVAIIPSGGRKVRIRAWTRALSNNTNAANSAMSIWDGTDPGSGAAMSGTQLTETYYTASGANTLASAMCEVIVTAPAGTKVYNVGILAGAGTANITASSVAPAFIAVDLV